MTPFIAKNPMPRMRQKRRLGCASRGQNTSSNMPDRKTAARMGPTASSMDIWIPSNWPAANVAGLWPMDLMLALNISEPAVARNYRIPGARLLHRQISWHLTAMKNPVWICLAAGLAALLPTTAAIATNPLITDQFSADPTARVFEGKIYVYPSHDINEPP